MGGALASARSSAPRPGRALFGIVQGGDDRDLRAEGARAGLVDIGFPGYAIGGLRRSASRKTLMLDVDGCDRAGAARSTGRVI